MKKALGLITLMAVVATASAGVDIFVTPLSAGGGVSAANAYNTAEVNFLSGYTTLPAAAIPNLNAPIAPVTMTSGSVAEFNIWLKFNGSTTTAAVPDYARVYGMQLYATTTGGIAMTESVLYRHKKANPGAWDRWDAEDPRTLAAPDAGILAAVTVAGISFYPPEDDNNDLYDPATGVALLGRVKLTCNGTGSASLHLGTLGVKGDYVDEVSGDTIDFRPELTVQGGMVPANPGADFAMPIAVPEPASMLLIGLAGLMLRRR